MRLLNRKYKSKNVIHVQLQEEKNIKNMVFKNFIWKSSHHYFNFFHTQIYHLLSSNKKQATPVKLNFVKGENTYCELISHLHCKPQTFKCG